MKKIYLFLTSLCIFFSAVGYAAPPSITSFAPTSGSFRDTILIKGSGFTGTTSVYFGTGQSLYFNVVDDSTLYAEVGPQAVVGDISVTTPLGKAMEGPFTVYRRVNMSFITPGYSGAGYGSVGDTISITGNPFSPVLAENKVYFGNVLATVLSASSFFLKVIVPPGAYTDYILVRVTGIGSGGSVEPFHVIPPGGGPVVLPWGGPPNSITGSTIDKVTFDPVVQTHKGHPYVQRHYDITPQSDPITATARIVLFFAQQDFDNYNAHPAHGLDLPKNPNDQANKANLRVYQYHGFSATSLPGSYSGSAVEIDPNDYDIVWNPTIQKWSVTFTINGFSGFFLGTAGNNLLENTSPTITSFTPTTGGYGTVVKITGTHFTGITSVRFGGIPAVSFSVDADTLITAIVGGGSTGAVVISSPDDTVSKAVFTHTRSVYITSFSPASATYLDTVIIKGGGFSGTSAGDKPSVYFGGLGGWYIQVLDDSTIQAIVPQGNSGNVTVSNFLGSASKSGFVYTQPLSVYSYTPGNGAPGTNVVIAGGPFDANPAGNEVYFGSTRATVVSASTSSLTVIVPEGATGGKIRVRANGTGGYSDFQFLVTPAGEVAVDYFDFDEAKSITSNSSSITIPALAVSDFNGDGKIDIAYVNTISSGLSILKNTGSSHNVSFTPGADYGLGGSPVDIVTGDVDLDGKTDILVRTANQNLISIFRNTSTGGNISFAQRVDLPVNIGYRLHPGRTMAVGDLNGDGMPEIVVADSPLETFSILKNTGSAGNISFAPKTDYPYGTYSSAVMIRDIDGDNKQDVILISTGNFFTVFKNTSTLQTISFASDKAGGLTPSGMIQSLTTSDYDGDGKADVAGVVNVARALVVFRNTSTAGAGSYASQIGWPLTLNPVYVNDGDFDGDGKKDILVVNGPTTSGFSLFKNKSETGALSFAVKQDVELNFPALQSEVGDVDGDGNTDIITLPTQGNAIYVLRNILHEPVIGSFSPTAGKKGTEVTLKGRRFTNAIQVLFGGVAAASYQVLNDSTITAIVDTGATGDVTVTTPTGTIEKEGFVFGTVPLITSFSPLADTVGATVTIKGDGFDKNTANNIVFFGAVKATIAAASDTALSVLVPAGATYQPITITTNGLTAYSDQRFIVRFPGAADSLTKQAFGDTLALTKEYDGTNSSLSIRDVENGDMDGDGKPDLVVADNKAAMIYVYRNQSTIGKLAFAVRQAFPSKYPSDNIIIRDVDGDGRLDIISSSISKRSISVLKNTSTVATLSFAPAVSYTLSNANAYDIAIRDLDGDGKPDLSLVVSNGMNTNGIVIFKNRSVIGTVAFDSAAFFATCPNTRSVVVNDVNGDGKPDLIAEAYNDAADSMYVFINSSRNDTLSFGTAWSFAGHGRSNLRMTAGDVDGDGKHDVITSTESPNKFVVSRNKSSENMIDFDTSGQYNSGPVFYNIPFLGDLDGDGKPDIAASGLGNTFSAFKNYSTPGNSLFAGRADWIAGNILTAIDLGDFDGDGKLDIAVVRYISDTPVIVYRNKIGEPFITPSGANPITGNVTNKLTIDSTVQVYNDHPYVQRHYDITPVNNPATATATITLYFTQQEFDNYNAHPAHGQDLPHNPADASNKANLRVYQYHGFSATSTPGTYSGSGVEIDPDDNKIVWNDTTKQWEVTFDVNGFSGFFLGSANAVALPVTLVSFKGVLKGQEAVLQWKTVREVNVSHFELEHRTDSTDFTAIARVKAVNGSSLTNDYQYADKPEGGIANYYRLKMVDIDGAYTYSKTVRIVLSSGSREMTVGPNPAHGYVFVNHAATTNPATISLVDQSGRVIRSMQVSHLSSRTRLELEGVQPGAYTIVWKGDNTTLSRIVIVQ